MGSSDEVVELALLGIHLEKYPLVFWIVGIAKCDFVHCLGQFSSSLGAYRDIVFGKAAFEFFVDCVSHESHKNVRFDPSSASMVHRADPQVRL